MIQKSHLIASAHGNQKLIIDKIRFKGLRKSNLEVIRLIWGMPNLYSYDHIQSSRQLKMKADPVYKELMTSDNADNDQP